MALVNNAGWVPRKGRKSVAKQDWMRPAQGVVPDSFVMDSIGTGFASMYGTQRLLSTYNGQCMRVRRSSDNAERDIGFLANGKLNETVLLAFAAGGNAYVTVWYDQRGAFNGTQVTASAQPIIVQAGAILRAPNGTPCIRFNGTTAFLIFSTYSRFRNRSSGTMAACAVIRQDVVGSYLSLSGTGTGGVRFSMTATANNLLISVNAKRLDADAAAFATRALPPNSYNRFIGRCLWSSGTCDMSVNGATTSAALASSGPSEDADANVAPRIGSAYGSAFLSGDMTFYAEATTAVAVATLDALMVQI